MRFRLTIPRVRKTTSHGQVAGKEKIMKKIPAPSTVTPPGGDSPDGRNESYAASSSGPRSFKTVSPTTITRGIDSRVTVSSSVVVASVNVVSISPTIADATSGARNTRLTLFLSCSHA